MKYLFSRFGGHTLIIGKGKASNENLPEDQTLDNMLENHATEIIKNLLYLSSYDMLPEFMGSYKNLPKEAVKLGDVKHHFNEFSFQEDLIVTTSIYITIHDFSNVFAVLIKTPKSDLKWVIEDYDESYDYVQTVFSRNLKGSLKDNPVLLEKILIILFYKMELQYGFIEFKPSKTYLGKRISPAFVAAIKEVINAVKNEKDLKVQLKTLSKTR